VVVGVGLDAPWPFAAFEVFWDEYSSEKQGVAGNCFRFNRIEVTRPSNPAQVAYFAYEVPAGTYVYSGSNANAILASSAPKAFIARPGSAVYLGNYVFVGNRTVEFRRDIDAARLGVRSLIPSLVLEPAEPVTVGPVHMFLCTP
jgi:hypothetical protein